MNDIFFVTSNKKKYDNVKPLFNDNGLNLLMLDLPFIEPDFNSLKEISIFKAKQAYAFKQAPVVVDDSGFFFTEYNNFPGIRSKWVYDKIKYPGIERLLSNCNRKAFAKTVCSITLDGKNIYSFEGVLNGYIKENIKNLTPQNENIPYSDIFIPEINDKFYHRKSAFKKCIELILKNI